MVFYECVITAKNTTHFQELTSIMKRVALDVVEGGGIVRGIHNHGIRELPQRFKAKYPDQEGNRYYRKGRFISVYYDCNPQTLRMVDQTLAMSDQVLRRTHLRARSILDFVKIGVPKHNPYVQRVLHEEEKEREAIQHRNDTVEQVIDDMKAEDSS